MLAAFPISAITVYAVQRVCLRTSKRIRHLDLEAKAPLYAHFTDAPGGIGSLWAFGWQDSSKEENDLFLDNSQRSFCLSYCVQRKKSSITTFYLY